MYTDLFINTIYPHISNSALNKNKLNIDCIETVQVSDFTFEI